MYAEGSCRGLVGYILPSVPLHGGNLVLRLI